MSHVVENEYIYGIGHTGKGCIATNIHNTKQTVYQCSPIHHTTCSMTTILIAKNSLTNTSCNAKTDCSKDSLYVQFGDTIVLMTQLQLNNLGTNVFRFT